MIWFDLVLWHINHCSLFNANSYFYIYIEYVWFDLLWIYGISTIVGYLKPNTLNMICKHILLITFLNEPEHFFQTVKRFQVLLYKMSQFNISHFFAHIVCR